MHRAGLAVGNATDRASTGHHTVFFDHFAHRQNKRNVGHKVRYRALQGL